MTGLSFSFTYGGILVTPREDLPSQLDDWVEGLGMSKLGELSQL